MFALTGGGLAKLDHMKNGGKRGRWGIDSWDRVRCQSLDKRCAMATNFCIAKYDFSAFNPDLEDILTWYSDGEGQTIDWVFEGTVG